MIKRIPPALDEVPEAYLKPTAHQGSVEPLEYETFEAFSYHKRQRKIKKKALVYLPFGYDTAKRYNVFYLMHGGGGNERT